MNELTQNTPSELLTLFVDGELEGSAQTALFAELAGNLELQQELAEHLAIRESVNNDTEAFTPPLEATNAVFAGLGFTSHLESGVNTAENSGATKKEPIAVFFKRIAIPVAAVILATFVTFTALDNHNSGKLDEMSKELQALKHDIKNNSKQVITGAEKNIPIIISKENDENGDDNPEAVAIANPGYQAALSGNRNSVISTRAFDSEEDIAVVEPKVQNPATSVSREKIYELNTFALLDIETNNLPRVMNGDRPMTLDFGSRNGTGNEYTIVARGITAQSYPSTALNPKTDPFFSNISVEGFREMPIKPEFLNKFMAGFSFGQEEFAQIFNHQKPDKVYTTRVEQTSWNYWGCLSLRGEFESVDWLKGCSPFVQMSLGGSNLGAIGKGIAGLNYVSESGLGMQLGLEFSTLLYKHQNILNNTNKLGLTYGLTVNF